MIQTEGKKEKKVQNNYTKKRNFLNEILHKVKKDRSHSSIRNFVRTIR